jgi:hypothetical protein
MDESEFNCLVADFRLTNKYQWSKSNKLFATPSPPMRRRKLTCNAESANEAKKACLQCRSFSEGLPKIKK